MISTGYPETVVIRQVKYFSKCGVWLHVGLICCFSSVLVSVPQLSSQHIFFIHHPFFISQLYRSLFLSPFLLITNIHTLCPSNYQNIDITSIFRVNYSRLTKNNFIRKIYQLFVSHSVPQFRPKNY